jgi:predicted CXXCH cytochrome family protein
MDHYEPVVLTAGLYQADGQILDEVYEYGSFLQSKMHANHVRCTDCHDPHSLKLKYTGNQLCTQCHEAHPAGKYDTTAHHHHKEGSAGAQCINCHMASRLYMVIDERRDHSFRVPRPDLSVAIGTSNACNDCHNKPDETFAWAADWVKKWYGEKPNREPHWGLAIKAGRAGTPEGEKLLLEVIRRRSTPAIVKATAIDLLGNYPSTASVTARREALRNSDPLVRLSAVRVLPGDNPVLLESDLAGAVSDSTRAVRVAAATRLAQLPRRSITDAQHKAFEKAMIEFREGQQLSLDHAGGHLTLASFDRQQGRIQEAVDHLVAAIKLEPYLAGPRAELASLMQEHGGEDGEIRKLRTEEADLVERDTKLAPDNADIFYRLGLLRYTLGEYEKAEAALKKACEKAPRNYEYLMALALLHEKRFNETGDEKQFNAAMLSLRSMLELNKQDPRARSIFQRLLGAWKEKHPDAKPPAGDR